MGRSHCSSRERSSPTGRRRPSASDKWPATVPASKSRLPAGNRSPSRPCSTPFQICSTASSTATLR
ncbi:hypothetical protein ACFQZ4_09800 [Catellatospora coxensis]